MFFSVIIPVYNVEKYLRESVDSVLSQDVEDLEILLVDDGSTDRSGVICDEYREKYPDVVRVIHKENEGLLFTRRCGIRAARGEWFVHLDSDDYMLPGSLLAIRNAIKKHNADLIICKIAYGALDGVSTAFYSKLPFSDEQVFENEDKQFLYRQLAAGGYMTAIYQKIARRDIVDVDKDYSQWNRVSLGEDGLQSLPLLINSRKTVFLDRPIIYYRYNGDSITKKKGMMNYCRNILSLLDVYLEEDRYLPKWNLPPDVNAKAAAMHCRTLCRHLRSMVQATNKKDGEVLQVCLTKCRKHPAWDLLFAKADRQELGKFCRICDYLIKHNWIRLLRMFCKRF